MLIRTEHIFTINGDGEIAARQGEVALDPDDTITCESDMLRPLHVSGLLSRDVALFLSYRGDDGRPLMSGYLVGHVEDTKHDNEVDGVIVPGDMVDADPRTWCSTRIGNIINFAKPEEIEQLGIHNLIAHIRKMKR